ncbi:hypothetical protein ACFFRR_005665 [Megaselia abdita]
MNQSNNVRNRVGWSNNPRNLVRNRLGWTNRNNIPSGNNRKCHRLPNFKVQRSSQHSNQAQISNNPNQELRGNNSSQQTAPVIGGQPVQKVCSCHCAAKVNEPKPASVQKVDSCVSMCTTVPLIIYNRRIRAALATSSTYTKIERQVADLAIGNNCSQTTKIFEHRGIRKNVKILRIPMGVRPGRTKIIECIVDRSAPHMGITLGLAGLKALTYRIMVDRIVAQHHGPGASAAQQIDSAKSVEQPQEPIQEEAFNGGDVIEALSEVEMREMMQDWENDN